MLQVLQPGDHLARVQTVSAAGVLLAGAFRERFGLLLGVPKRQSTRGGDAVDEKCRVAIKISERAAHRLIVRLAVTGDRRGRWSWPRGVNPAAGRARAGRGPYACEPDSGRGADAPRPSDD